MPQPSTFPSHERDTQPVHCAITPPITPDALLMKRQRSGVIENPFVKPQNRSWEISPPASLTRSVSPPPTNPRRQSKYAPNAIRQKSDTAAVEAGEVEIKDHVSFFSSKLLAARRPHVPGQPRLPHQEWLNLYQRNLNDRGHHFVVHQHDHPVAGTHYDLRLQCNATSSISFAIMYGLPGDPNSRKLNRNATETRVHNLWNHLIETASYETGTMLLWDTGEFEILPSPLPDANNDSDPESNSMSEPDLPTSRESEPEKLQRAFQNRKIRLRLHGSRLPKNYTLNLRLTHENNRLAQPSPPAYKRRRKSHQAIAASRRQNHAETSESDTDSPSEPSRASTHDQSSQSSLEKNLLQQKHAPKLKRNVSSLLRKASPPPPLLSRRPADLSGMPSSSSFEHHGPPPQVRNLNRDGEPKIKSTVAKVHQPDDVTKPSKSRDDEDDLIRLYNAYPGATNSINSIHQRKWFLSLDREACGFRPTNRIEFGRRVWERPRLDDASGTLGGFAPFYVRGRDVEASILTGRLANDVASDEGLVAYKPRGGWRAVTD
ncbi:hypothetical protein PV08_05033 [Exophiala spinifera]|uniref:DNA ligase D 3'-phosphoesterase domain-containing protein n=1 Tax=Exophiala spinifera TaxID=91928 RepID=A0A0D2BFQ1_9EURO|nr:uncharacterized protein PV08_05033 [Exophiala spinifera]KIW17838.1 hypothetical protein PV08_05033 [Exophiala spinifera]